jgi:hypothetical protein
MNKDRKSSSAYEFGYKVGSHFDLYAVSHRLDLFKIPASGQMDFFSGLFEGRTDVLQERGHLRYEVKRSQRNITANEKRMQEDQRLEKIGKTNSEKPRESKEITPNGKDRREALGTENIGTFYKVYDKRLDELNRLQAAKEQEKTNERTRAD